MASSSSAVGEILNVTSDSPAGLVAADDGQSFAVAINNLLRDSSLRARARAQAESYSWSNTVASMLTVHGIKISSISAKRKLKVA